MELGYPIAAAIAAVPATLAWLSTRKIKQNVGVTNGRGTVSQMSESVLIAFEEHAKLDDVRFKEIAALVTSENDATRTNTDDRAQQIIDAQ